MADPTLIGTVQGVSGSTLSVELRSETASGFSMVAGEGYRVGQIGGFVRVPLGTVDLVGIVAQVGAGGAPEGERGDRPYGNRWLRVELVGESRAGGRFERGLTQYPTIDDPVHLVTSSDLAVVYGSGSEYDHVRIGRLASSGAIPALVDVNKLLSRHAAVVGSTGSGKSTTVAGILSALSDESRFPASRVVLLDVHGEYSRALGDRATVFRVGATAAGNVKPFFVPFWALSLDELLPIAFGESLAEPKAYAAVSDLVLQLKLEAVAKSTSFGLDATDITADTPVPFCIHKLWLELHKREFQTVVPSPGGSQDQTEPAFVKENGKPLREGDAMTVTPPLYRTVKTTGTAAERVQYGPNPLNIRRQVLTLGSRLRDPRFAFMFKPGKWLPGIDGATELDLDSLLEAWVGAERPISILDLSGVPTAAMDQMIGGMLRVLYDAMFWSRNLPEGARERPLLLVLEEAHAYLGKGNPGPAADVVRRIAKEGRKYGVGLLIVSQRPTDVDATVLSQCGTIFALRLSNEIDRAAVTNVASESLRSLFSMLPVLRTGEAIVVGEAVSLPIRALIDLPPGDRRPDSVDPLVAVRRLETPSGDWGFDGPGGWNQVRDLQDYQWVVRAWRSQQPKFKDLSERYSEEGDSDELD